MDRQPQTGRQPLEAATGRQAPALHVMLTANAGFNIRQFRMPLLRDLAQAGHHLSLLIPEDAEAASLEGEGFQHLALRINAKGLDPREALGLYRQFQASFRATRPDVVLGFTIKNNIFGAMAAKSLGIAFLPNVTGLGTAFLGNRALRLVAELLYRRAFSGLPVVFFQNDEDRDLFEARRLIRPGQGQVVAGSGINLQHFAAAAAPLPRADLRFLMIARLLRDKGVEDYVAAARLVRAQCPDIRFQLIGSLGPANRSAISASTLAAWQAEGVIDYLGPQADVRPFIAAADCVVLPSYREGAPRVLMEAAAMARPVIASDVPGCRAVVQDKVTGLLCKVRDADSLAQACMQFRALPEDYKTAMREAARQRMTHLYDEIHVVGAYRTAIARLTGRDGSMT